MKFTEIQLFLQEYVVVKVKCFTIYVCHGLIPNLIHQFKTSYIMYGNAGHSFYHLPSLLWSFYVGTTWNMIELMMENVLVIICKQQSSWHTPCPAIYSTNTNSSVTLLGRSISYSSTWVIRVNFELVSWIQPVYNRWTGFCLPAMLVL